MGAPRRARMMYRLNQLLNLTPDQKAQAKAIFQNARTSAQPLQLPNDASFGM